MAVRPLLMPLALAAACGVPDDTLFTRPGVPAEEIAPGVFRATWNPAPDVVRGFTPDGERILYLSRDLTGLGDGWYVLSQGVADGAVREEAGLYRQASVNPVGHLLIRTDERLLVTWRAAAPGTVTCVTCPEPPTATDVALWRLPPTDGVPLSSIGVRNLRLPNHDSPNPCRHRIRLAPFEPEVRLRRVNPFGPVERADGAAGFASDGQVLWRYDPTDPAAPADSLGPGAFPALSPTADLLAAAVPVGLDSLGATCTVGLCPCVQETVTITATGWEIVLYDLVAGTTRALSAGLEPAFDPLAPRLVARRATALYWIDLQSGAAEPIPGTDGAYAPAVAPDGSLLAFSTDRFGNPDVFYVRIR